MRNTELYPELQHNRLLVKRLTAFFALQSTVYEVSVFGSLAMDTADRWSEVDLIVVTAHPEDQAPLFASLRDRLQVVYHRPFQRDTHTLGAYISGVLFAWASPFHLVNLHFLTLTELENPEALHRYYGLRRLHQMKTSIIPPPSEITTDLLNEAETVDEARVYDATNVLRRKLRQVLRRQVDVAELNEPVAAVEALLAIHPSGMPTTHGDVCVLANRYLAMAKMATNTEHNIDD